MGVIDDDLLWDDPNDDEVSENVRCRYCGAECYWGPFYDAQGRNSRRLFNADNQRPHDCRNHPDPNAFDVVPE